MTPRTILIGAPEISANRLDLVTRLADDLAHEVKNPLHAMVINLELIRRRLSSSGGDGALERVDVVESEIGRINRLVDSFFQLLRPGKDRNSSCDVAAAVNELLPLVEAQTKLARVELRSDVPPVGVIVAMARDPLKLVLLNLLMNAVDALRPGGGAVQLSVSCNDTRAEIRVCDNGPGVDAAVRDRIGQIGVSTRAGRSGLGLAVVSGLVDTAGGSLELAPASGGAGACFTVVLPRATAA